MVNLECSMENKIDQRVARLEEQNKGQDKLIEIICSDIKDIKKTLLARPSWAVTIILTGLCTLCCGLIVYIIT